MHEPWSKVPSIVQNMYDGYSTIGQRCLPKRAQFFSFIKGAMRKPQLLKALRVEKCLGTDAIEHRLINWFN